MSVVENGWFIVKNVSFGSQLPSLTPSLFFTTYMRRQGKPVYSVLVCKKEMIIKVPT